MSCAAMQAEFTTPTTLTLTGIAATVQYHDTYMNGAQAMHRALLLQAPFAAPLAQVAVAARLPAARSTSCGLPSM